jgi:hypothetical protein
MLPLQHIDVAIATYNAMHRCAFADATRLSATAMSGPSILQLRQKGQRAS